MTEQQDPRLKALFADARQDLEGDDFAEVMMAKTRLQRYRMPALLAAIGLAVIACAGLLAPSLVTLALLIGQTLTATLIDFGDGWLALVLAPINTISSLIILGARAAFIAWKRITRSTGLIS